MRHTASIIIALLCVGTLWMPTAARAQAVQTTPTASQSSSPTASSPSSPTTTPTHTSNQASASSSTQASASSNKPQAPSSPLPSSPFSEPQADTVPYASHVLLRADNMASGQQPMSYAYLRKSDIAWQTTLWKRIDLNERFNQYIYFPIDEDDPSGKKNLIYTLWHALERNELPIYEDDALLIPIEADLFIHRYTKPDTILLEIGYDEDDNELYETVVRPNPFDGSDVYGYELREVWFIGKADTRLDSRRMALAPLKPLVRTLSSGETIDFGVIPFFWVPMQNPQVRRLLASNIAYFDENNLVGQPSWDQVFVGQMYHAYTTRESNRYNRQVQDYLTGTDALYEALSIEQKVFDIGEDMWEY